MTAAYEVLYDADRRALYDQHGVWPPENPAVGDRDDTVGLDGRLVHDGGQSRGEGSNGGARNDGFN